MTLSEELGGYVLGLRYEDLPKETVAEAKKRIVDALGCAVGAFKERPVGIAREVVGSDVPGGPSTIIGTRRKSSPDMSTFVNGLMVRYFDFNDTYLSKEPAHPSDNLAPALAVAEARERTGKELITALVAAYEVQCRLCDAADIRHRGWDHVNYGLVSSSLAASKLMGLPKGRAAQAVNIAVNGHVAMRQVRAGELSMWKGASFANAARNGVFAALLAEGGMTGPAPIFEGEMGFFKQVSGPFKLRVGGFGGRKGGFKLDETYIKYWPVEYHAQTAVWAARGLRERIRDLDRVKSVLVETHEAGYTILAKDPEKWSPKTKESADHSLPYIVAMALIQGKVDNSTYSEANLGDKDVAKVVAKVKVVEDKEFSKMYPSRGMANRITATLQDGTKVSSQDVVPLGHPGNPMSKEAVEEKFMGLTKDFLGERGARGALRELWSLEKADDLGELLGCLRVAGN